MKDEVNTFKSNLAMAFFAQIVSLSSSTLVSFLVPKFIGITDFSYWQMFAFYVTYINLSRLGIIDGLYLRLGGKKRNELDKSLLGTEWKVFSLFQLIVGIAIYAGIYFLDTNADRRFVLYWCCICLIIINSSNFLSYILQAINETKLYSISVCIFNLFWFIAVGCIYFLQVYTFKIIVLMYTVGQFVAWVYLVSKCKDIIFSSCKEIRYVIEDIGVNVKYGIGLMLALYINLLIIGSARFVVDLRWGIDAFGIFSFSLTLSNFFLRFISQTSMVLFPTMKRLDGSKQISTFEYMEEMLYIFLPVILFGYIPIRIFIGWWLPDYVTSANYLCYLLPVCILDGKMQLIYSTFFKVVRKEKILMFVNIISAVICFSLSLIGAYVIDDMVFVIVGINGSLFIRNMISKIFMERKLGYKHIGEVMKEIMLELLLILLFILVSTLFNYFSIVCFGLIYMFFLLINHKKIIHIIANRMKKN